MREICEGEARDEEERNPDEGDSPHHGLKDRSRKNFERQVEERDRGESKPGEKLGEICGCFSVLQEVSLKTADKKQKQQADMEGDEYLRRPGQ